MDLLHGRTDLFARRWKHDGRSGYSTLNKFIKAHNIKLLRHLLVFFIVFSNIHQLPAQEKLLPVFIFHQLTNQDGVRNYEIRSDIIRDQQGLIWFGTANGLFRYDGYTCKAYYNNPSDSSSISANGVISLYCDTKGRLWLGTWDAGLSLYDSEKDQFINFLPRRNDSSWIQAKSISTIYEDQVGNIWLGSNHGVILINTAEFKNEINYNLISQKIRFRTFRSSGLKNEIYSINDWDEEHIIVSSIGGLYLLEKKTGIISSANIPVSSGLLLDTVITTCLFRENTKRIWIGTAFQGLFLLDQKSNTLNHYHKRSYRQGKLRDDPIRDLQIDDKGRLWIGTEAGLDLFDPYSGSYVDYLKYNLVPAPSQIGMKLSFDKQGTLWIGTGENSVYFIPRCSFRLPYYGLGREEGRPKQMESIYPWIDSSLWIGCEGKAIKLQIDGLKVLSVVDIFKGEKTKYGPVGAMSSFYDKKSTIWYGGWGVGIFKFQPMTGIVKKFDYLSQLTDITYKSNACWNIAEGIGDTLWIAMFDDGIIKFDPHTEKFSKFPHKQFLIPPV